MNRNHGTYYWAWMCAGVLVLGGGAARADVIVFSDAMDYADNAAIQAAWANAGTGGNNPAVVSNLTFVPAPISGNTPAPVSQPAMSLANGVRFRELGTTLTNSWTLELKMLMSNYSRSQRVYLLNATGTEGYGLEWGSTNVNQNSGNGLVSIRKFSNNTYTNWDTFPQGALLGSTANSLHPVTGYAVTHAPDAIASNATYDSTWAGMADIKLTWDSTTNVLTLYVDGDQRVQATDADFSSFSRIYLRGNTAGYFDEIKVSTIPEPGAMGLITAAGGVVMLRRHRSDRVD